ncbi:MAG: hypothetical protein ACKVX7_16655, partial [Planctomycetota bacterium]
MHRFYPSRFVLGAALCAASFAFGQDGPPTRAEYDALRKEVQDLKKTGPAAPSAPANSYLSKLGQHFRLFGFLRLDIAYDDSEMNNPQLPFFVNPENGGLPTHDDELSIYTKNTRLGLEFKNPDLTEGYAVDGLLEVDFYGNGTNSRNEFRSRHAFLRLSKAHCALLAGQTFDLFSPLMPSVNVDNIHWNVGNTGDRRPQLRFSYMPEPEQFKNKGGKLMIEGALALQSAVDNGNLDGDGNLDGEDSGMPQIQARVGYHGRLMSEKSEDFQIGTWIVRGWEETDVRVGGHDNFDVELFGFDVKVPIVADVLAVKGEWWIGKNLDDLRGGIGQGISAIGEEVNSMGYWFELGLTPTNEWNKKWKTGYYLGYAEDNPARHDLPAAGRIRNQVYSTGFTSKRWDPVSFGAEYLYWETEYNALLKGDAHRLKFVIAYSFSTARALPPIGGIAPAAPDSAAQ